ncbi:MAG: hypothetical protein H0Z33_02780 [Bacillaceae bacterium]|nr:hypothetical protein [Bacillaceae bacterium]
MLLMGFISNEGLILQFFIFGIIGRAFLKDSSIAFVFWTDLFFVASFILLVVWIFKKIAGGKD